MIGKDTKRNLPLGSVQFQKEFLYYVYVGRLSLERDQNYFERHKNCKN